MDSKEKSTLVIHFDDPSTEMLKYVYEGKGFDVIRDPEVSKDTLIKEIIKHDRIMFLGHGCQQGLLNPLYVHGTPYKRDIKPFIIDESFVSILKGKETFSVWCFSDVFFKRYGMKGFHTGMIISEPSEERYFLGYCPLDPVEMERNITEFCKIVGKYSEEDPHTLKERLLEEYNGNDPVTKYNRRNIIVLD